MSNTKSDQTEPFPGRECIWKYAVGVVWSANGNKDLCDAGAARIFVTDVPTSEQDG